MVALRNEDGLRLYYVIDARDDSVIVLHDKSSDKQAAKLVKFDLKACFIDRVLALPATAATDLKADERSHDKTKITWVGGSGSANLVFATDQDSELTQPQVGVTYTANPEYGKGSRIGARRIARIVTDLKEYASPSQKSNMEFNLNDAALIAAYLTRVLVDRTTEH